jgi:SAM-dependent methyltransferase
MKSNKRALLWEELAHQAQHPPGGDEVIAAFYQAMVNLGGEKAKWRRELERSFGKREMPDKHKVNLLFRAVQYLLIFIAKDNQYPHDYADVKLWEKRIPVLFKRHRGLMEKILQQWDTGTTIYQRYAGVKAIISALWPGRKIAVLDLGCGGNHGLPGLMVGEIMRSVVDHSQGEEVTKWLNRKIGFNLGMSVDKHDAYDPEVTSWRVACSFYPSELNEMREFMNFEKRIKPLGRKIFFKGDITCLEGVLPEKTLFDAVVLSTVLYQMEQEERVKTLLEARKKLVPGGILIVQDFVKKAGGGRKLEFNGSWFKDGFAYRTYIAANWTRWRWWETLAWYNGRCKQVREGEDFAKFFAIVEKGLVHVHKRMEVKVSAN